MKKKLFSILVLWLTIAATAQSHTLFSFVNDEGAATSVANEMSATSIANEISATSIANEMSATSIANEVAADEVEADEVKLRDGSSVKRQRVPKRAPTEDYTYTYKGVKYTYITKNNIASYFNTSVHQPSDYGWYTDAEGWYVNAEKDYITAASIDTDNIPSSGEIYILNDLVGFFKDHTHLGCIADNAFRFNSAVRRVYFQDCGALSYTANTDFYFFIGDKAFADCENLEEVNLMQWTTSGSNHWQALPPTAVKRIWGSMLDNSPKAWLRVGTSVYQQYLGSQTWVQVRNRITTFEHSSDDITVNGVVYSFLKAEDGSALSNADDQHEEIMKTLRLWNADYQNFNAASLLSDKSRTQDNANLWYTTVKGADNDYLKKNDGVLRIYNDPGSYYNYKTIAIRRGAFENCDDLKAVEFWQTNGRSNNSYSEPKLVIENGAFTHCRNLKEIRLFYKLEDGTDRWQVLGPTDVIPGNNIFGLPPMDEVMAMDTEDKQAACALPDDFRILVSPDRYSEFIVDPNWSPYANFIKSADYMPTAKADIVKNGLTYGYVGGTDGILSTDQVVTQSYSLWSIPTTVAEVASIIYSFYSIYQALKAASVAVEGLEEFSDDAIVQVVEKTVASSSDDVAGNVFYNAKDFGIADKLHKDVLFMKQLSNEMLSETGEVSAYEMGVFYGKNLKQLGLGEEMIERFANLGICNDNGLIIMKGEDLFAAFCSQRPMRMAMKDMAFYFKWICDPSKVAPAAILKERKEELIEGIILNRVTGNVINTSTGHSLFSSRDAASVAVRDAVMGTIGNSTLISGVLGSGMATAKTLQDGLNMAMLKDGMKNNVMSNIHAVSTHASNMVIITPHKNLIYHTYLKSAPDDIENAVIYTGVSKDTRTTTWLPQVFKNKKQLKTIRFHDNSDRNSHNMSGNLIFIPDSAFVGCDALETLDLRLMTNDNGERAMGPEAFVLCGDDIFAGLDSTKFHIIIPIERRIDFLLSDSWRQHKRFFVYQEVEEKVNFTEFGVKYAFSYQNANQYVEKQGGHTIEHLHAIGPDDDYIKDNNGALGFFNDIGSYNNYKLDYARMNAFRKNQNVKSVSFWDVAGWLWTGDAYTDLQMTLQDSCFAECPNLEYVDMLYLRTDGSNIAEPLTPRMLQLGNGVFDQSPKVRFKMTDRQTEWFAADSAWVKYQDRFLPALFLPADPVVVSKLSDLKYRTDVARPWYDNNASKWGDWLDITRVTSNNFLNGKFAGSDLRSFPDFKRFELIGLDYVGGSWFVNCTNLSAIELPSTIKTIGGYAFQNCSSLKEITIPAAVEKIDEGAFFNSGLKTVRCEGIKPPTLGSFGLHPLNFDGFVIYVPAEAVDAYKQAWPNHAQYIRSNADDHKITEVEVDKPGKLAEKLGLTTIMSGDRLRNVGGAYWKYDSLTVRGHLNGLDVGVLRHLMGADAWDSDPTDGRLRYLDLHNAHFDQDTKYSYNLYGVDEYLEKANWVGEYMFQNCTALETLILPASVTEIGENAFERATNLKHLFVGQRLEKYTRDLIQDIPGGLDELVLMTDSFATSESEDPWEGPIAMVYTKKSRLGDYMSDPALTNRAQGITAPFEDEEVMRILAVRRCYFPSQYLNVESTKNPFGSYLDGDGYFFYRDKDLKTFDEFRLFSNVRELDYDFQNCSGLERITLPASIEHIGFNAFTGCAKLASIHISADSVPVLDRDAFRDLPADFQIIVPKTHVKRYREQWAQYADHVVGEDEDFRSDIIEVTLTEPNTLAQHLGLQYTYEAFEETWYEKPLKKYRVTSVTGDYSHIRGLKVNGPISSADFMVMRFLAGFDIVKDRRNATSLGNARNYLAQLEYIDLYDADIVCTDFSYPNSDGEVETKAFCRCYALKTLILPRTATYVAERAFQECENLQTLVIGDECEKFLWSSLDDCASMTRMYILSKKKMEMTDENWLRRNLSNNYNPTFDAVYVRPSLYQDYLADEAYVGPDHRTNSVSTGAFKDDESFAAFAAHAAATQDDLRQIGDISGWFRNHTGVIDFDALQYTSIDSLRTADVAPLTQLRNVTLPATVKGVGKGAFTNAARLRYVDMSKCADYAPTLATEGGVRSLGIGANTLAYVPSSYGETADVNVAVGDGVSGFKAQTFRLVDGLDYCVPFALTAENVENTRTLVQSAVPYTVCLPYALDIPVGAKVYRLSGRDTDELIFTQHMGRMQPMEPYLVWAEQSDAPLSTTSATLPASTDGQTFGRQQSSVGYTLRGTLSAVGNAEAVELGAYVMNDDAKWHPVLSDTDEHSAVTIPAFRCYLLQSRQGSRAAIGMALEGVDGIEQLRTIDSDGTERVYDLSGRRVSQHAKGVVIKNGKKVIKK